jgi:hypothetical protein
MADLRAYLAARGRTRLIPGDNPPDDIWHEIHALVREHRTAVGLPVAGYGPITARDVNDALDWKDQQ